MKYTLEIRMAGERMVGIIEDENGNQQEVSEFYQQTWSEQLNEMNLKAMGSFFQMFVQKFHKILYFPKLFAYLKKCSPFKFCSQTKKCSV